MSRKGIPKMYPDRKNVTLRCSADVWARARVLTDMLPGVTLSDIVEDILRRYVESMELLQVRVEGLEDRDQVMAALDQWFADLVGQQMLQFVRDVERKSAPWTEAQQQP